MAGFRNRIINGNGRIAQRGDVAIAANGAYYGGADRINVNPYGCTTVAGTAHQYYAGGFGISGYGQAFYNVTTTGAASSILFGTKIESQNAVDMNSKTVTFSCKVFQDTGSSKNCVLQLYKPTALDNFASTTNLGNSGAFVIPSSNTTSISFSWVLGSNDATNGLMPAAVFDSFGAVTNKSFIITDMQLEIGSVATPFEQRNIAVESTLCQRYYEAGTYNYGGYTISGVGNGQTFVLLLPQYNR